MDHESIARYIRERWDILQRRRSGLPRSQWTKDPILSMYKFCNVLREDDRTTIWCRENVREQVEPVHQLLAIALFRWFNRITTGEAIFLQESLGMGGELPGETAWVALARMRDVGPVRASVLQYCGKGPYVTGAYIIKTPDGRNKLDGVLWCIEQLMVRSSNIEQDCALDLGELSRALVDRRHDVTLKMIWQWLCQFPYLGGFMAAQIVADLKYTPLLQGASDWHTWAASGPGSRRGLAIVTGRDNDRWDEAEWLERLLELRDLLNGVLPNHGIPILHAQDVQNNLCEFSKYTRGSSRNKY